MQLFQGSVFSLLSRAQSPGNSCRVPGQADCPICTPLCFGLAMGLGQLTESLPALSIFLCTVAVFPAPSHGANRFHVHVELLEWHLAHSKPCMCVTIFYQQKGSTGKGESGSRRFGGSDKITVLKILSTPERYKKEK